jgi:hypothetical protein
LGGAQHLEDAGHLSVIVLVATAPRAGGETCALRDVGFEVAIETNDTWLPPPGIDWVCVSPKAEADLVLRVGDERKRRVMEWRPATHGKAALLLRVAWHGCPLESRRPPRVADDVRAGKPRKAVWLPPFSRAL